MCGDLILKIRRGLGAPLLFVQVLFHNNTLVFLSLALEIENNACLLNWRQVLSVQRCARKLLQKDLLNIKEPWV